MAEAVKKQVKSVKPDENAMLAKTEKLKPLAVKAQSDVQTVPKPEEKAVQTRPEQEAKAQAPKVDAKEVKEPTISKPQGEAVKEQQVRAEAKTAIEAAKSEAPKPEAKAETKAEAKKEADPSKEFVDGIMVEMSLKGASKKRLIKMLIEQYGLDKQKVMFRLKRALITERYAAAHAEAGH